MIMDILAALALAAERPSSSAIDNPPVKTSDSMITKTMWRMILGMTLYTSLVMLFMFLFLDNFFELPYANTDPWFNE